MKNHLFKNILKAGGLWGGLVLGGSFLVYFPGIPAKKRDASPCSERRTDTFPEGFLPAPYLEHRFRRVLTGPWISSWTGEKWSVPETGNRL